LYYSDEERKGRVKPKPEIAIQGIGATPDEFKNFIGETIRLDPIMMDKTLRLTIVFLYG
jgi:topoisomerase-4 subunit B